MLGPIIEVEMIADATVSDRPPQSARLEGAAGISLRISSEALQNAGEELTAAVERAAAAHNLPVAMIDVSRADPPRFSGITHRDREMMRRVSDWLQLAIVRNAESLILPVFSPRADISGAAPYSEALAGTYRLLCAARHEAEQCGVCVMIDAPADRFLLSPAEVADLAARVASPHVGVRLDVFAAAVVSDPCDWIAELGRHVRGLLCRSNGRGLDWTALRRALDEQRFGGPLVLSGDEYPRDTLVDLNQQGLCK